MKKYKDIGVYDFSDYAEEITGDALFEINGGAQIENSIEAQANAKVGDTVTREDGTTHTLYQGSSHNQSVGVSNGPTTITEKEEPSPAVMYDSHDHSRVFVDLDNPKAMQQAADLLAEPSLGLRVTAYGSESGITKNFKNYQEINDYLESIRLNKYKGYNVLGSKANIVMVGKEIQKQPLWQLSFGDRKAALIGAGYSIGIVINPNNLWDSGVKVSAEIGTGIEVGLPKEIGKGFSKVISSGNILSSTVDFSKPTSTCELEGFYNNAYVSAGVGGNFDIKNQSLQGLEVGNIGGGVYWGETKVYTAGEIVEGVVNTVAFIGNNFVLTPTMRRMTGGFKYIELDGQ